MVGIEPTPPGDANQHRGLRRRLHSMRFGLPFLRITLVLLAALCPALAQALGEPYEMTAGFGQRRPADYHCRRIAGRGQLFDGYGERLRRRLMPARRSSPAGKSPSNAT